MDSLEGPDVAAEDRFHKIRSLTVQGGFLDGLSVELDPALNCIIGGRGTGKTTVLEFLRFAFEQIPDASLSPEHHKTVDTLVRSNLGTGVIKARIETAAGLTYDVERTYAGEGVVLNEAGKEAGISLARGAIFGAEFYSQNQIEEIANNPRYQLELIDKFVLDEVRAAETEIGALRRRLQDNAGEILRIRRDSEGQDDELSELPEVTENLRALGVSGPSGVPELQEESEKKALRGREQQTLGDAAVTRRLPQVWSETQFCSRLVLLLRMVAGVIGGPCGRAAAAG